VDNSLAKMAAVAEIKNDGARGAELVKGYIEFVPAGPDATLIVNGTNEARRGLTAACERSSAQNDNDQTQLTELALFSDLKTSGVGHLGSLVELNVPLTHLQSVSPPFPCGSRAEVQAFNFWRCQVRLKVHLMGVVSTLSLMSRMETASSLAAGSCLHCG